MESKPSRRSFLSGAGLAVGALALAGATTLAGCAEGEETSDKPDESSNTAYPWEKQVDVIVIGAGTSLLAALEARKAGATVLILEKADFAGGDTALSGGVVYAAGTKIQEKYGAVDRRTNAPDTIESAFADWIRHSGGNGISETLVRKILESGPQVIDYFSERGVDFMVYQSGTDPINRGHKPPGTTGFELTDVIVAELEEEGADLLLNTCVNEILTDPITDRIIGVKAKTAAGEVKFYGCKALILGCGGTGNNTDLTMQYNPEAISWINIGYQLNMGEGFLMADKLHVQKIGQGSWLDELYPCPVLVPVYAPGTPQVIDPLISMAALYAQTGPRSMIFLNSSGKRFTNETAGYVGGVGITIARLPGAFCWNIADKRFWEIEDITRKLEEGYFVTVDGMLESGMLIKADTIDELCELIRLSPDAVKASIAEWNTMVAAGVDTAYQRPTNTLLDISEGPFYAYKLIPASCAPQVGASLSLNITDNCEVLDINGFPIPGLYAVGTGMTMTPTLGRGYPGSGSNLMAGFGSSLFAGPAAAAFALNA
jgi:hypothetical protein